MNSDNLVRLNSYLDWLIRNRIVGLTATVSLSEFAGRQIERAVAYGLPIPKWIKKKFPVEPRKAWFMDYSVGGPLWQEWQRLETHSEWERWQDLYGSGEVADPFRWRLLLDWLLENNFPVEAEEIRRCRLGTEGTHSKNHRIEFPEWESVSEDPNPEPVEGAA